MRGKGLSPRSGGLLESNGPGTQKVAGIAEGGSNGGLGGTDRNVRLVPGDIYFKSWGRGFWETIFGGWLQSDLGGFVGGVDGA